jgi:surface polysaccharide O-acyltransferase-like enzyme
MSLPIMLEAWLLSPQYFSFFVDSIHGWVLGLICFFLGFIFISMQDVFWPAIKRTRWLALVAASLLYLVRLFIFHLEGEPNWLVAFEAMSWMLAVLGFAAIYLNKPSRSLDYFSKAVYPVYIVHMPLQFVIAYFLLPLNLSASLKLIILLVGTFGMSLLLYEYVLRRLKWIRPLFGMKLIPKQR